MKLPDRPLFSLKYDGSPAEIKEISRTENGNQTSVQYAVGALTVTTVIKKIGGAYEWVNYLENRTEAETKLISELNDCDIFIDLKKDELPASGAFIADSPETIVYAPKGSDWSENEFTCDAQSYGSQTKRLASFYPGTKKYFSASGGRSSQKYLPMLDINQGDTGFIIAIGWTGQWFCSLERTQAGANIKSGIEELSFVLYPGEKIRTSSFLIMPYSDGFINAHNAWRRLIKNEYSPIGKGKREAHAPLAVNFWGGLSSDELIKRAEAVGKRGMGYEYFWIDAGWHGHSQKDSPNEFEGDWSENVGSWNVNGYNHPDMLRGVSRAVGENGMKLLLWFEPERVRKGSDLEKEHPEFLLHSADDGNLLLDLGSDEARKWCFDMISGIVRELNVKCYRQDFNFDPLAYWRLADEKNRKGIHEIKHIMGLYRLWDDLLKEFDDLIIDNCASGGRRIDIETLKRSVPLWRSDYQCPANHDVAAAQCHTQALSLWIPYHGTSVGRISDVYRFRSCYTTALGNNFIYSGSEDPDKIPEETYSFIRRMNTEYKKVRGIMEHDYYPLNTPSADKDGWGAMEFFDSEKREGIILACRRENSPYSSAEFFPGGMEDNARYELTDADTGEKTVVSGAAVNSGGITVTVNEKRSAKLIYIKQI